MLDRIKDSKLFIGLACIIQAVAFVAHFLISYNKRRSESGAYLVLGVLFGAAGAYMLALERLEDEHIYGDFSRHFDDFEFDDDDFDGDDSDIEHEVMRESKNENKAEKASTEESKIEIPVDETADETEFS